MLFRSNDTATTEIYTVGNTLSLHDALPISGVTSPLPLPRGNRSPLPGAELVRAARFPGRAGAESTDVPTDAPPDVSTFYGPVDTRPVTNTTSEFGVTNTGLVRRMIPGERSFR